MAKNIYFIEPIIQNSYIFQYKIPQIFNPYPFIHSTQEIFLLFFCHSRNISYLCS